MYAVLYQQLADDKNQYQPVDPKNEFYHMGILIKLHVHHSLSYSVKFHGSIPSVTTNSETILTNCDVHHYTIERYSKTINIDLKLIAL